MLMTEDRLIEEICDLVQEYTCMKVGCLFKYDLRGKVNQFYEDNCISKENEEEY